MNRSCGLLLLPGRIGRPCPSAAQVPCNHRLDSLERHLPLLTVPDTERVKTLNELVWENRDNFPCRALALATEALALGHRLGFRRGIAKAYTCAASSTPPPSATIRLLRTLRPAAGSARPSTTGRAWPAPRTTSAKPRPPGTLRSRGGQPVASLRLEQPYGTPERIAQGLVSLGSVFHQMGQYAQILSYQGRYLRVPNRLPARSAPQRRAGLPAPGANLRAAGSPDSARWNYQRATSLAQEYANWYGEAQGQLGLGRVLTTSRADASAAASLGFLSAN